MNKIWLVILLVIVTGSAKSQALNGTREDSVMKLIEARLKVTQSQQLDFTLTRKVKGLAEPIVQEGEIHFVNPDKLKYHLKLDQPWLMVVNGNEVYTKEGNGKVEKRGKAISKLKDFIISGINGDALKGKEFNKTFSAKGDIVTATLKPTGNRVAKYIEEVYITFTKHHDVSEFTIVQPNGNTIRYDFRNLKRNLTLADSLFILK